MIEESRYLSLHEQIDAYDWMVRDGVKLSKDQIDHLRKLRNTIIVFGKRAKRWVEMADKLIKTK